MADHINGTITAPDTISGSLSEATQITGYVVTTPVQIAAVLTIPESITPAYDIYEGSYEVTPRLHDPVTLETAEKLMVDDVTIHEIPITRTTNPQNGITVLIG